MFVCQKPQKVALFAAALAFVLVYFAACGHSSEGTVITPDSLAYESFELRDMNTSRANERDKSNAFLVRSLADNGGKVGKISGFQNKNSTDNFDAIHTARFFDLPPKNATSSGAVENIGALEVSVPHKPIADALRARFPPGAQTAFKAYKFSAPNAPAKKFLYIDNGGDGFDPAIDSVVEYEGDDPLVFSAAGESSVFNDFDGTRLLGALDAISGSDNGRFWGDDSTAQWEDSIVQNTQSGEVYLEEIESNLSIPQISEGGVAKLFIASSDRGSKLDTRFFFPQVNDQATNELYFYGGSGADEFNLSRGIGVIYAGDGDDTIYAFAHAIHDGSAHNGGPIIDGGDG